MTSSAINPSPGNPTSSWKPPSSWNPIILARKSRKTARSGGRGGGIRTPTRGFGDRWSTVKPTPLLNFQTSSVPCRGLKCRALLDLLVRHVLTAERAELFHLQPLRGDLLILHAGVVLALAI